MHPDDNKIFYYYYDINNKMYNKIAKLIIIIGALLGGVAFILHFTGGRCSTAKFTRQQSFETLSTSSKANPMTDEFNRVVKFAHNSANFDRAPMIKNLEDLADILDEEDIFFWLSEGTALGAIRENQIITNDTDVDIGIYGADYATFYNKCLPKLIDAGFKVGRGGGTIHDKSLLSIYRNNSYIDIDITEKGKNCAAAAHLSKKDKGGSCMKILRVLKPFSTGYINNRKYNVPSICYIKKLYGNNWKIPEKNHGIDTD